MTFDPTYNIGNIITLLTVVISLVVFLIKHGTGIAILTDTQNKQAETMKEVVNTQKQLTETVIRHDVEIATLKREKENG